MSTPPFTLELPEIPATERTVLVQALLDIIGRQQEALHRLTQDIEALKDENRKLKGGSGRPKLKPNQQNRSPKDKRKQPKRGAGDAGDQSGGHRHPGLSPAKVLEQGVELEGADPGTGWEFKGYRDYWVEEVVLEGVRRHYKLAWISTAENLPNEKNIK